MKPSSATTEQVESRVPGEDVRRDGDAFPTGVLDEQVRQALRGTGYGALNSVEVSIDSGHVTLRGPVRSFHQKQIATSVVLPLDGVKALSNELTVTR